MSRPIDEIMGEALAELREREDKLEELLAPAKAELAQVQRAIKKLDAAADGPRQGRPKGGGATSDGPPRTPEAIARQERVLAVLGDAMDDGPLSTKEVGRRAQVDGRGIATLLRALKSRSLVAEPEDGLWL